MLDEKLLSAIAHSPGLWSQAVLYSFSALAGLILASLTLFFYLRRHRARRVLRSLHRDTSGVAAIMDFTLVLPIFVMIVLLTLQLALMANASVVVHYAAYSAARAAKTQLVDFDHAFLDLDCCSVDLANKALGIMGALSLLNGSNGPAREKVFAAAAWPLVALAPSSSDININTVGGRGSGGSQNSIDRVNDLGLEALLQNQSLPSNRKNLLLRKAKYAYSNAYLEVDYGSPLFSTVSELWAARGSGTPTLSQMTSALGANAQYATIALNQAKQLQESGYSITTITSLPVFAEVRFYFPLLVPWASALFHEPNSMASNRGRWLSAKVELI